jgi:hypothetical protein
MNATNIISTYGLQLTAAPVMENPFMAQESADMTHYYCNLHNDDISFDFYMSLGSAYSDSLTPEFCLARVLEDVGSFRNCSGYQDFCKLIGVEEDDDKARLGFDEVRRISENLDFLLSHENELDTGPTI